LTNFFCYGCELCGRIDAMKKKVDVILIYFASTSSEMFNIQFELKFLALNFVGHTIDATTKIN